MISLMAGIHMIMHDAMSNADIRFGTKPSGLRKSREKMIELPSVTAGSPAPMNTVSQRVAGLSQHVRFGANNWFACDLLSSAAAYRCANIRTIHFVLQIVHGKSFG